MDRQVARLVLLESDLRRTKAEFYDRRLLNAALRLIQEHLTAAEPDWRAKRVFAGVDAIR